MELMDIMKLNNFVVVGNTINEDKYAYKIKQGLINAAKGIAYIACDLITKPETLEKVKAEFKASTGK